MNVEMPTWMEKTDERILHILRRERVQYPALIAGEVGAHMPVIERRCQRLESNGLIEPVSGEVVYRLTDRGQTVVDEIEPD